MNDVTKKYKIGDRNTEQAMSEIQETVNKSAGSNFEVLKKETKRSDISKLTEGKRYIDKTSDGTVRLVFRVGKDIYYQNLSVISD